MPNATFSPKPSASPGFVLGADIGGTSTRVAIATTSGEVVAVATGGAGNPAAIGLDASGAVVRSVVAEARAAARIPDPSDGSIVAAVLGLAGVTTLHRETADSFVDHVMGPDGARTRLVSDLAVAYASGTWQPHGIVTIAGTGSGAVEIDHGTQLARRDAWGWLLGDEGSGWWLGREAVRAALSELERGVEPGPVTRAVMTELGTSDLASTIAQCYARTPRALSELAPVVSRALPDPTAAAILDRAARVITARVQELSGERRDLPIVLAGSLVTGNGPLSEAVRERLGTLGFQSVHQAGDGLAGALWLASATRLRDTGGPARQWSALLGSLGDRRRRTPHIET